MQLHLQAIYFGAKLIRFEQRLNLEEIQQNLNKIEAKFGQIYLGYSISKSCIPKNI